MICPGKSSTDLNLQEDLDRHHYRQVKIVARELFRKQPTMSAASCKRPVSLKCEGNTTLARGG